MPTLYPKRPLEMISFDELSFPESQQAFYATIAVESTCSKPTTLPFNCQLVTTELFTPVYETEFQEAAQTTAKQLLDSWETFVSLSCTHFSDKSNSSKSTDHTSEANTLQQEIQKLA